MQRRPEYAWRPWRSELQRSRSLCLAVNAAWRAEYPREPSFAGLILRRRAKLFMTAGQVSDDTGAAALPDSLPAAEWMLADRDHDADWFRDALQDKGIRPLHPRPEVARQGRPIRQAALSSPKPDRDHVWSPQGLAPRRHTLRQMRKTFLSAVALAATVIFCL